MSTRRAFLKTAALGMSGFAATARAIPSRYQSKGYFGVHPFIEQHPEAVFIMKTDVDHKMNVEAKLREGLAFSRSVFVPTDESGVSVNISIPVKPNLKAMAKKNKRTGRENTVEQLIGTATDPYFCEGIFEGIKELGVSGKQFHLRESNRPNLLGEYGYFDMVERVGADLRLDLEGQLLEKLEQGKDYNWTEVSDGVVFNRIPHIEPVNTPGTWMLNIAKFKSHYMGMTLCCKNLQGMSPDHYQHFCMPPGIPGLPLDNMINNAEETIRKNHERHVRDYIIPRWDKPGTKFDLGERVSELKGTITEYSGGLCQERWASKTLDNVSVTRCGLSIVEGIYGRDSDSTKGPHPFELDHTYGILGQSEQGRCKDYMTNIIIFGKDPILVDNIGHWLGGHEPGNFGFFHLALERGMTNVLDTRDIPVYLWDNGEAVLTPLEEFKRTKLLTVYLRKDYNGMNEPPYHMVDEPFDYSQVSGTEKPQRPLKPEASVLYQRLLSPDNPRASIEYMLPDSGFVKLEIKDADGHTVAIPAEGFRVAGIHMANWDTSNHASGRYSYLLRINDSKTESMIELQK